MRRTVPFAASFLVLLLVSLPAARAETGMPPVRSTQADQEAARPAAPGFTDGLLDSRGRIPATRELPASNSAASAQLNGSSVRKLVRHSDERSNGAAGALSTSRRNSGSWATSAGALVLVLLSIFAAAAIWKKYGPKTATGLPADVIEVLGKRPLNQRHAIHLVRCGSRLLIVGSSADGLRTLAEVTDPVEVEYLAGLCRRHQRDAGMMQSFRQLLNQQPVAEGASSAQPRRKPRPAERGGYAETADLEEVHG